MTTSSTIPNIGSAYAIEGEVGRGGMATVYRAHDRRHNRRVAVKVLDREVAASLGTTRFLQEITTAAGLSHPNIVPVHDSGEHEGVVLGAINLEHLGQSRRAQEWAQRALQLDPSHPVMLYNIGCFHAVAGRAELALDHLERAVELGFHHRDWLLNDPDLSAVHDHPRFQALLQQTTLS